MNRRKCLKFAGALCFGIIFHFFVTMKKAKAGKSESLNLIDEQDTLARAMRYRHDAKKAPAMRTNKKAFCHNCSKYNVCVDGDKSCKPLKAEALGGAKSAPCRIFKGKNVLRQGWCLSWEARS